MLVLSRKLNETIRIGDDITVTVVAIDNGTAKLGISAPAHVPVHRGEVYERIQEENRRAARSSPERLASLSKLLREGAGSLARGFPGHGAPAGARNGK